ncbi:MAG: bifunctional demethylmenaquinone methyltransferase/2-methoxy-6-polyprenyl-1,4-benzoquinol methylase UbiE [Hyphomicrobiaceae bacterium]|nr:bifunctional demethylmenaquinone methyltransferase/2-methoxy-6-polyprenyl-1,4-benzoquinol methylase UbiE [Hyphomicrobiaceae bacterium]
MATAQKSDPASARKTVSFGFRPVPEEARQGLVNEVFSSVAGRYDLMNDLMSGGLHRLWKDDLIGCLAPPKSDRRFHLIDVAGGTGDITLKALRAGGGGTRVTLLDISPEMVEVGRRRIAEAGLSERVAFTIANAEALPFPDKTFDAYTIAFGIRNVTHIDKALSEAYRILKTGGRFLCLEFSACEVPLLDRLYDFHSFEVIPRVGQLVAGDAEPYRYLAESIRKFPKQGHFAEMIRAASFSRVSYRNLTGGIAAIHSGWRT